MVVFILTNCSLHKLTCIFFEKINDFLFLSHFNKD